MRPVCGFADGSKGRPGVVGNHRRLLAILIACLIPILSCGDDDEGVLTPAGGGVITGRVSSPSSGGVVELQATADDPTRQLRVLQVADSTGAFAFALPFGRYHLSCSAGDAVSWYSSGGPTSRSAADTLVLAPGRERWRADFAFGGIRLAVDAPGLIGSDPFVCHVVNDSTGRDEMSVSASPGDDRLVWELPFVPPGTHRITLETPRGQAINLPFGGGPPEGKVVVRAGEFTDVPLSLPAPTYVLGAVLGSWQRLHGFLNDNDRPKVLLRVRESASAGDHFSTVAGLTDVGGNFAFLVYGYEVLPWVTIGGVQRGLDDFSFPGTAIRIESGRETRLPDHLESGLFVTLEPPGDAYTAVADVEVYDAGGTLLGKSRVVSGNCTAVCNLIPGSYLVRVVPRSADCRTNWLETWYDGKDTAGQATPITIGGWGDVVPLTVRLVPGGTISGTFTSPAGPGNPSPPRRSLAIIRADADSGRVFCSVPNLDPNEESFRYQGLPDGQYRLRAEIEIAGRIHHWWFPGAADARQAGLLTIEGHDAVEGLSWMLP